MKRSAAWISVVLLFVVGVLSGVLGTHLYYSKRTDDGPHRGPRFERGRGFLDRMAEELELSAEQMERVEQILDDSHAASRRFHEEMYPRVQAQMERTRARIREVLTPEQQERFESMSRRHRRGAERLFLGPRRPPPPPRDGRGAESASPERGRGR